jgi:hypothetical protein
MRLPSPSKSRNRLFGPTQCTPNCDIDGICVCVYLGHLSGTGKTFLFVGIPLWPCLTVPGMLTMWSSQFHFQQWTNGCAGRPAELQSTCPPSHLTRYSVICLSRYLLRLTFSKMTSTWP